METKSKSKQFKYLFILILLFGLLLRTYNLSSESIIMDEAIILEARQHPNSVLVHPPFYFLFLNYWTKLSGDSEFAIRFPSVIFGFLSIFVIYYLARYIFNERIALLSALFFSINPFLIFYSQRAVMYNLFVLLTLLTLLYFFKALKESKKNNWQLYFVFNLLNLYTHYFAVFVIFIEVLYFVLFYKNFKFKLKPFILINSLVLVLFSPQFFKIYNAFLSKFNEPAWGLKSSEYFISIFSSFFGWNPLYAIIAFLLLLFGLSKLDKKTILFCLIYVLIPVIIGFFLSLFGIQLMPRYFIFVLPIYIIIISKGIFNIDNNVLRHLLILGIIIISLNKIIYDFATPQNEQWRELVYYIEKEKHKGDVILFDASYTQLPFDYYYNGDLTRIGLVAHTSIKENEIYYVNDIKPRLLDRRVWLILSNDYLTEKYYKYRIEQDFRLISSKKFIGISVGLYDKI